MAQNLPRQSLQRGWSCWALGLTPLGLGTGSAQAGSEAALPALAAGMAMLGSLPVQAEFQLQPAILAHGFVKPGVHR